MTLVTTLTASASTSLSYTSFSSSAYKTYMFLFRNLVPSTGSASLTMDGSTNGGGSYGSLWAMTRQSFDSTGATYASEGSAVVPTTPVNIASRSTYTGAGYAGAGFTGYAYLNYGTSGVDFPTFITRFFVFNTYTPHIGFFQGQYQSTSELNTLRFQLDSGNFTRGTIAIYGITT